MNFDPVYLRAIRKYTSPLESIYLNYLPVELQILLGKYLLYNPNEKFSKYTESKKYKNYITFNKTNGKTLLLGPFNDQSPIKQFVTDIINDKPTELFLNDF